MNDLTSIGGVVASLSNLDPNLPIFIDNRPPTALSSYRGYYDHLAIERSGHAKHEATELDGRGEPFELNMAGYGTYSPGNGEVRIKQPATVGEFVKALDLAVGETFEGYKGGQYTMWADTDLWVSEYGECNHLRITAIEALTDRVDLVTTEVEW